MTKLTLKESDPELQYDDKKFSQSLTQDIDVDVGADQENARRKRRGMTRTILIFLFTYVISASLLKVFSGEKGEGPSLDVSRPWPYNKVLNGKPAEKLFLQIPTPESLLSTHKKYASRAHIASTPQDLNTAHLVLERFHTSFNLSFKFNQTPQALTYESGSEESRKSISEFTSKDAPRAWIDTYYPLLDTPHFQSLEVVNDDGTVLKEFDLQEDCDPRDPDVYAICSNAGTQIPPTHAYSPSGDVTGELVYANYGSPSDFEDLESRGIDVSGKIVLVRTGAGIMRGLKIYNAEKRGAIGVLVYSDPVNDDGGVTVENGFLEYPDGPARKRSVIQRGSVGFVQVYAGDPSTPGVPAYKNSTRVEDEKLNIPRIPSLPLSWANAEYLLSEMDKSATRSVKLRLISKATREIKPIWNTMALIPGYITDEIIVVGNHRDAWGLGAVDPSSGSACMDEVFRALGLLYQKGWKPLRTILFASWDAEEYGMVGSVEWNEDFEKWFGENVVAYVNLDVGVRGTRWTAGGVPSLSHFIRQVAQSVPHPIKKNATLWDTQFDFGPFLPPNANLTTKGLADELDYIFALGSGSDYSAFVHRNGIAATETSFNAAPGDAVYPYHSIYDSIPFVEKFVDPGYHRFTAMSKYLGLQTLRLADAIILPINVSHYAVQLRKYTDKVEAAVLSANELDSDIDLSPLYKAISALYDASQKLEKEKVKAEKALFKSLEKWHKRHPHSRRSWHTCLRSTLRRMWNVLKSYWFSGGEEKDESGFAAHLFDSDNHLHHGHHVPRYVKKAIKRIRKINSKLASVEAGFISKEGLPGRSWYRHLGVAPSRETGNGATTLPALTESITLDKNATLARVEVERLTKMVKQLAKNIN